MSGRAQKYERHQRVLYGLVFKSAWKGRVYIGQTVDAKRRAKQHGRTWAQPFEMVQLEEMTGTQAEAEDHEYAWRFRAGTAGFQVIAKSWAGEPFVVSDTRNRMTAERWAIAKRLKWPREMKMRKPWAWFWEWLSWEAAGLAGVWALMQLPV